MGVNQIGKARACAQLGNECLHESGTVGGQRFLGKIAAVAAVDPGNDDAGGKAFARLGIVRAKLIVVEKACDDLGTFDAGMPCQCCHFSQNVGDVTAGIFGNSVLYRRSLDASSQSQGNDMH